MELIWLLIDSSSIGGAERHTAILAASLARRGMQAAIVLYADHGANPWLEQLAATGLPARVLDNSFITLLKEMHQQRPALVHTHGYKAGILGRLAARLTGVPVVSTFHSGSRGKNRVYIYDWMDEWTSFLGRRIAVSEAIKKRLPFSSAHIPSFVLVSDPRASGALPRSVGFVGRLSEEKGPDIFCEIARRSPPGIDWHIFGDGPMGAELKHKFGHRIQFHGIVTDLSSIWPSLGLLLMPSRSEGVPLAALEALANGVPVLASRVGGLPSVVLDGVTGWLFENDCLSDALDRLQRWCNSSPAAQNILRRNCWIHVRAQFSEQRYLPDILDVYRAAGLPNSQIRG